MVDLMQWSYLGDESLIAPEPECNFDNPPRKDMVRNLHFCSLELESL